MNKTPLKVITLALVFHLLLWTGVWAGGDLPAQSPAPDDTEPAVFQGRILPIPDDVRTEMKKHSWRPSCPVKIENLTYLELMYWGFDGQPHRGELIVHSRAASEILDIFKALFEKKYPIEKMRLIDTYQGDDHASMADNNTSAFNCRPVEGSRTRLSRHSYGLAIDINPLINPYVKGKKVLPPAGAAYLNRKKQSRGMIVPGGPCHQAFTSRGWRWGGDWNSLKDYQHFEKKY